MKEKETPSPAVEIIISQDGSDTLFVPALNEYYHSVFGAINESRHIFIRAGFNYLIQSLKKIRILEIGFGTGLNAILTCLEAIKEDVDVSYMAIELYPLKEDVFLRLNYADQIDQPGTRELFDLLHTSPWEKQIRIRDHFSLTKIHDSVLEHQFNANQFDLIYFDAFGPDVQPEMWSLAVFHKMASAMKPGGVLVTYSTKGLVKRNLKEAGFIIEKLPGPTGKREILRAVFC